MSSLHPQEAITSRSVTPISPAHSVALTGDTSTLAAQGHLCETVGDRVINGIVMGGAQNHGEWQLGGYKPHP